MMTGWIRLLNRMKQSLRRWLKEREGWGNAGRCYSPYLQVTYARFIKASEHKCAETDGRTNIAYAEFCGSAVTGGGVATM